ncbi:FG-GAP-like repeat-containing protein, partial [candidate division KSB1 bacterium]
YDGDGDLDLAITGQHFTDTGQEDNKIRLYKNDPVGTLTEDTALDLGTYFSSDFVWADIDDDGDLDMVVCGQITPQSDPVSILKTAVFINDPAGTLTEDAALSANLPGVKGGSLAMGDYDGDPDLVVSGFDNSAPVLSIFENNQTSFDEESLQILDGRGVYFSSVSLIDVDTDGDLELASFGLTNVGGSLTAGSRVYDNVNAHPNLTPFPPEGLVSSVSGGEVALSWQHAVDLPTGTLRKFNNYQVRIGIASRGNEVVSGAIQPALGAFGAVTSRTIKGLVSGDYYWSVRTIDNGLAVSDWAFEQMFRIDTDPPVVSASSVAISPDSAGIGEVTVLLNIEENFELDHSILPDVTVTLSDGGTEDVSLLSYSEKIWIGTIDIAESFTSGAAIYGLRTIAARFIRRIGALGILRRREYSRSRPYRTEQFRCSRHACL